MSTWVPPLLHGLIDDAALLPPGGVLTRQALTDHSNHRAAWYADVVGPLLLPASCVDQALAWLDENPTGIPQPLAVGVVADAGPAPEGLRTLAPAVAATAAAAVATDRFRLRRVEIPVAMRNQDPLPGLRAVLEFAADLDQRYEVLAEIPLTWGLLACLDRLSEARADGLNVSPKLRTGGLAAELFPTPMELAAVICACRDRNLPFTIAAGRHRAVRRTDPETGLVTHGFINILAAVLTAADGGEPIDLAEVLGGTDPQPVVASVTSQLRRSRPFWVGLGASCLTEPIADLTALNLLPAPPLVPPL